LTATVIGLDRAIYRVAARWVGLVNLLVLGWLASIIGAPLLRAGGQEGIASVIYAINRPFCHQRADRSFRLLGEKMACCERCFAIYVGILLFGVFFLITRSLRPLPWPGFVVLSLPILIDALSQGPGWRESTPFLRVTTGLIFAIALSWLLYPHLERGFRDMRTTLEFKFARLAAEGRAAPLSRRSV